MTKYIYKLTSFILIISQIFTPLAYADGITYDDKIAYESEKQVTSEVDPYSFFSQKMIEKINKNSEALGVKWVKGGMQSFSKYNFSGFIVLDETLKKLSFFQGNFTYDSKDGKTLNIGLGRRTLVDVSPEFKDFIDSKEAMLEINSFYDLKNSNSNIFSSSSHSRYSLGFKLSTPKYDFYGNLYQRGQSAFMNDERVLNGHDFGVSGRMPKVDNLKINLKRYSFSGDVDRKSGVKLRAEYYLTPHLSFGGEYDNSDQNNSSEELFLNFRYNFGEKLSQKTNNMQSDTAKIWDRRYDEVIRENKVYLEKKSVSTITSITAPSNLSGNIGSSSVDASLNAGDGSGYDSSTMGAVTYSIEGAKKGATINSSSGAVDLSSATISSGTSTTIKIKAVIAPNNKYLETTFTYNFTIDLTAPAFGNISGLTKQLSASGTTVSDAPNLTNAPTGYDSGQHGNRTFTVTSATNNVSTSNINVNSSTGVVTLPANTGATVVTVTVSTAGGTKYAAGSQTYNVAFTKISNLSLSFDTPTAVAWGTSVSAVTPTTASNYNVDLMGTLSYALSQGTDSSISIDSNGVVTATQSGSATVKVSTAGGTKYDDGEVGTYNVTFNKQDLTINGPSGLAGNAGSASTVDASLASGTGYDSSTMGAVTYSIDGAKKGATINSSTGAVNLSSATISSVTSTTITIKASIAANDSYNLKSVTYTLTINRSTATGFNVSGDPATVTASGGSYASSASPNSLITAPSNYSSAKYGAYAYTITSTNNIGASVNSSTGVVSNVNSSGTITVQVTTLGGNQYNGTTVGSYDVTFNKQEPAISGPSGLSGTLGSTVDVALASGTGYDSSKMGTVTYSINGAGNTTGATTSGGTLDLSGATISPAAASATIQIRATIAPNGYYNAATVDYNVTVNRAANPYSYLGSSLSGASNLTIADDGQYTLPTASNLKLSTASNGSSEVAYNAAEMGALSFEVENNGGITGISTGSFTGTQLVANPTSTGAGNSGTITIKLKLAGGTKYNAKEFTYNVTYE